MIQRFRPFAPLLLFCAASVANAQNVEFANFQTGSFNPSASPTYLATTKTASVSAGSLGSFLATISTSGTSWAAGGAPTGVVVQTSWVEPSYSGQLTGLTVLGFLGGIDDTVTIQFDFATLPGGVLPAGSIIAYNDVDGGEQAILSGAAGWYSTAVESFYQVGTNVGSPWGTNQPTPGPSDSPFIAGSSATNLVMTGTGNNTDGITNFIVTLIDLTSLNITATGTTGEQFANAIAIGVVPEPSSTLLIGVAGAIGLMRRRRI